MEKIINAIFAICMIVITIAIVVLVIKLTTPDIYVTKWEQNGITYYLSNAHFITEPK